MVKIPTYEQQGEYRPSGRIVQGVRTPVDDGVARGLVQLGQAGVEIAGRIQQANLDQELVKAETDLRVRMDKARQAIELDPETPDVAIPQRWKQESEAIIGEVGGTISSAKARELWTVRARGLQSEGDTWSVNLQRKRQVDGVRAGFVAMASEAEAQAGDMSISEDTYAAKVDALRALNDTQVAGGFVDKEEGARRQAVLENLALKDRTIRWTSNIDALVKDGRVAEAQAMFDVGAGSVDPQTRARVKEGLDASKQDYAAVEQRDAIWAEAKGDYGTALQLAGKIKDVPLRLKVEAGLNDKRNQDRAAEDARQDGYQQSLWSHVVNGGTIMNASPSLRAAIDPGRMGSIRAYENARDAESGMNAASKEAWRDQSANIAASFKAMAATAPSMFMQDPAKWSPTDQMLYAAMTPDDQRAIMEKREGMITGGKTADATSKVFSDLMTEAKRWAPKDWQLGGDSQDARENKDNLAVTAQIYRLAEELAPQMGGTAIQQKDAQFRIAQLFSQYKPGESWLQIPEWAQAKGRADSVARVDAAGSSWAAGSGIDWALWNEVKAALPGTATSDDVMEGYKRAGGRLP